MKNKKLILIAAAAANAISIAGLAIMSAAGISMAGSQGYNQAAAKWDPEGGCSQISCFLSDDAGFTTDTVRGVSANLYGALKNISIVPEEGKKLIPEAYSTPAGQMSVKSDTTTGRAEAQMTAVGGDFFLFRDFDLLSGSYFSDSDIMQDGAVIDRTLAWSLYGSVNVSGMNIYINGTKFYIAGVIDDPQTKQEKKTAGDLPRAYISYEGAALLGVSGDTGDIMGYPEQGASSLKKITCYECICPDPVENYAVNAVNDYFTGSYNGKCTIVNNSKRFSPSVRAKAHKKLADYAVTKNSVVYPYWENASRLVEFKLTSLYFYRRFMYIAPVLTILAGVIFLYKLWGKTWRKAAFAAVDGVRKINYNRKQKKANNTDPT